MSTPKPIGDPNILRKVTPASGKYGEVGTKLNTGHNTLKVPERHPERKDEKFKRMKTSTLHRLLTGPDPEVEVVLLDVRDKDEFETCHIAPAQLHPHTLLSRAVNPFLPIALQNKNKEGVLIVVYDMSERTAPLTATIMFEQGFDNVMMLSGGLRKYVDDGFTNIWGTPPPPPKTASTTPSRLTTGVSSASGRSGSEHSSRWK